MLATKTKVRDKICAMDEPQAWSAHSSHTVVHLRGKPLVGWGRTALKEALIGIQFDSAYHQRPAILEVVNRLVSLEQEVNLLQRFVAAVQADAPTYITAEKYPALVAAWDNDDDDVYNNL